jgi:hypothetical protein
MAKHDFHVVTTLAFCLSISAITYGQQSNILFVEDNAGYGTATHPDSLWHTLLTNLYGLGNFGWYGPTMNKYENGPDLQTLQNYALVIWNNYDHYGQPLPLTPTLTATDQTNISNYINSGGKFWLIAQDVLYSGVPLVFFQSNFGLDNYSPGITGVVSTHIQGLAEAAGPDFLVTADYVTTTVFYADDLIPGAGAHHIIRDTDYSFYPGILRNDSITSFWTIDGRRPVLASVWEDLVSDMLDICEVAPGVSGKTTRTGEPNIHVTATPNVFRYHTDISYSLLERSKVSLVIYDPAGSRVAKLFDGYKNSGTHRLKWEANDQTGERVAAGVYFIKFCCSERTLTTKVTLLD